jgi:cation transport ATPase
VSAGEILHETRRRLRLGVARGADLDALAAAVAVLPGVEFTRVNTALRCVVVQHDGRPETRAAVLARFTGPAQTMPRRHSRARPAHGVEAATWAPAAMAIAVPLLPRDWRPGAALGVVAARVLTQGRRLRSDPAAVLLDAASLAALALSGQPQVVSTSVLLRLLSERLSSRLVRDADGLLDHLLPTEASEYTALHDGDDDSSWLALPVRTLRPGDRVRLLPGDVVPVDGCVVVGSAVLAPAALQVSPRPVSLGDHVAAGERLREGTLELRAEADAASSRLARLRAQVQHAIGSRDPVGQLAPGPERMLSLPLTAAALVLGLTGDSARAAAMLQADPQQGLDLALPLAREAALYALARQGLLTAGLEAVERLATARTLVLQDTGVLANGRWTIEAVHTEPGGDAERVRRWLAALADTPLAVLDKASFPDRVVRQWVRHGALLRLGEHELHLASRQRLQQVWGLTLGDRSPPAPTGPLRRELAVVAAGRVVARVVLASALRDAARERLSELAALGFQRVAVFAEADGGCGWAMDGAAWTGWRGLERIDDDAGVRADWFADAVRDGSPVVIAHTVLRDLVPAGSVSLAPMDADAGSHGVLLGDPLASLVAARRLAQFVHRRVRLQQGAASVGNAALMTAAALRWLPPMATTLLHHGMALLLLLDSLRFESAGSQPDREQASPPRKSSRKRPARAATIETLRSETP